jgi:hypothetical protein
VAAALLSACSGAISTYDGSETNAVQAVASMQIEDDYERSSVNLSGSSVTGEGDATLIVIKPRVQESEAWSGNRWLEPSARVRGVNGFRPTFRFIDYAGGTYHGYPWQSTRRPMFSYDRKTWTYFDTAVTVSDGSHVEFRHSTAFTANVVYISRGRQVSVRQTGAWLENLHTAHPTKIRPSRTAASFAPLLNSWPGQDFIAEEFESQTNELGASIPATPFYAAEIDDASLQATNGTEKKLAVITAGAHAGEDLGNILMQRFVETVLGPSAHARALRRNYRFLLYPMLNAPGRAGGGQRGSFTQGTGGADDLNRHFSNAGSNLEIVDIPKAAMTTDRAGVVPSFTIDFHAMYELTWGTPTASNEFWLTEFRARQAVNAGVIVSNLGAYPRGTVPGYFASLGTALWISHEIGDPSPLSEAAISSYASALVETFADMDADGLFAIALVNEINRARAVTQGQD